MLQEITHTLGPEHISDFLERLVIDEHSPATVEKYARALRRFYAWLPESGQVSKKTVMEYKSGLAAQYAPAGVNTALAALNGLLKYLDWQECRVKPLRIQRRVFAARERELTREEYARLVAAAEARGSQRLSLLLQLMAATGLRVSEIHAVTVAAVQRGKAEISMKGKSRVILLPGKLCRKLLKYAKKQKIASGELFLTRSGRPMNRKEIWAQMKTLCRAAGVEPSKVFPHNLRHLFARVFYALKKDISKLADLLGHSNMGTTRIYLLTSGEEHAQALEALELVC